MATRNLNFTPEVQNVVAEAPDRTLEAIASVGADLADQAAKSRMLAASANVQTEFKKLDADFRLQSADDPTNPEALKGLGEKRQQVIDTYGESIPLLYRRQWNQDAGELALQSSLNNDLWGVEQQRTNVVKNINDSISTYLTSAQSDGMAFGKDSKAVLSNTMNFLDARGRLEEVATPVIGPQKTREQLEHFDSDYVKTFVSGVVEANPQKALELLDKPEIRDTFKKPDEYIKFKEATERRAKYVAHNNEQAAHLAPMKESNAALANGGKMGYSQIQQANLTPAAKEYFEALNGFAPHGRRGGYTPEDKAGYELAITDAVQKLHKDEHMDAQSVRVVQDAIYKGMNAGAISQTQGQELITQIVDPLIANKEQAMSQYGSDSWFTDAVGFDGVQEFYDNNVAKPTSGMSKSERVAAEAANKVNKANLYDYYMGALTARAKAAGTTVVGLGALPKSQRQKIYATAQTDAQTMFVKDKVPALRTLPDTPNFVLDNGQMIQGVAGPRNVKADLSAPPKFRLQKNKKTGETRRVYPDGRVEMVK